MKHLIAAAAAALLTLPGAAQAQNWLFPAAGDTECYAMTLHGNVGLGFQAPSVGNRNKAGFLSFAPPGSLDDATGDVFVSFAVPGPLGGTHNLVHSEEGGTTTLVLGVDRFEDFARFPDRFRVKIWRGTKVLTDTEVTGFTGALATIKRCVAAR